ncbi:MAG: Peroxiredoxin, partial [uncultured Acetobacteraceae bacterium]
AHPGRRNDTPDEAHACHAGRPQGNLHRRAVRRQNGRAVRRARRLHPDLLRPPPARFRRAGRRAQGQGRGRGRLRRGERRLRAGRLGQEPGRGGQDRHAGGRERRTHQEARAGDGPDRARPRRPEPAFRARGEEREGGARRRGSARRLRGEPGGSRAGGAV